MRSIIKPAVVAASALLAISTLSGCAHSAQAASEPMGHHVNAPSAATKAADLRVTLNKLLGEHVVLATNATGAALGGRAGEFQAAAAALDANSVDIANAVGSVYGTDAGNAFLPLWRQHIGFVVDYTNGLAAKDKMAQDQAMANLLQYACAGTGYRSAVPQSLLTPNGAGAFPPAPEGDRSCIRF